MLHTLNFIDLFAGAGGLSEGFIRAGYTPLAHIEMNNYACDTLKTRAAFHWLKNKQTINIIPYDKIGRIISGYSNIK
jgi:DNA (cytosine-5)-methyltransferase 1